MTEYTINAEYYRTNGNGRIRDIKRRPVGVSIINIDKIDLFVKGGLEKAKAFGIANKTEMQCFLEYLAINGVDKNLPKKKPWLHTLLRRDDLSQLRKIREIKIKASTHNYN